MWGPLNLATQEELCFCNVIKIAMVLTLEILLTYTLMWDNWCACEFKKLFPYHLNGMIELRILSMWLWLWNRLLYCLLMSSRLECSEKYKSFKLKNDHWTAHRAVVRSDSSYSWCMVLHGISWYSMVLHDIAWSCIVLHSLAWYCTVLHGIAWYCMVMHCIAGYCTICHGAMWYCMVLHCIAWYGMVLHGIAWYCMLLHSIPWYGMVLLGIAW